VSQNELVPKPNRAVESGLRPSLVGRLSLTRQRRDRILKSVNALEKQMETLAVDIAYSGLIDLLQRDPGSLPPEGEMRSVLSGLYREGRGVAPNSVMRDFRVVPRD